MYSATCLYQGGHHEATQQEAQQGRREGVLMPIRASIPGKAHPAGWSQQSPYDCPNDPMPRNASGLSPDVVNERTPAQSTAPIPEQHTEPRPKPNETGPTRDPSAEGMGDGLRTGRVPADARGAPKHRMLPGVRRHG